VAVRSWRQIAKASSSNARAKHDQPERGSMRLIAASSARSAGSNLGRGTWRGAVASSDQRLRWPPLGHL